MINVKKLLTGAIATMGMGIGVAAAGGTANADSVYTVQSGDTLSSIAQKELGDSSRYQEIVDLNNIQDANTISVGQVLKLSGEDDTNTSTTVVLPNTSVQQDVTTNNVAQDDTTQQVQNTTTNTIQNEVAQNISDNSTSSNDNGIKARRRQIESGGNYNTNTGNGYVGAYQFAPSTIASIENATGMKWSMDPSTQDKFADYYANQRYGGWQNVPTNGGW